MIRWIETLILLLTFVVILLAGCSGCGQKTAKEFADPYNQSAFGPVPANSRMPASELPPFQEPSFDRLIEQFKADVVENKGDPEVLKRKKEAIANPDLLWDGIGFEVPPTIETAEYIRLRGYNSRNEVYVLPSHNRGTPVRATVRYIPHQKIQFEFEGKVFYTTSEQEERMEALRETWTESGRLSIDYYRRRSAIMYEGIDALSAARNLSRYATDELRSVGIEYAERAMREDPNSVAAMHAWVLCHSADRRLEVYHQLLSKFPNAAFAHERVAAYYYRMDDAATALYHMEKAVHLDSRIAKKNDLLAKSYFALGKWEQAVAAYQGMDYFVNDPFNFHIRIPSELVEAKDKIRKQRKGYSLLEPDPLFDNR